MVCIHKLRINIYVYVDIYMYELTSTEKLNKEASELAIYNFPIDNIWIAMQT